MTFEVSAFPKSEPSPLPSPYSTNESSEFDSIRGIGDPDFRAESLFRFARQLEGRGRMESAAATYASLLHESQPSDWKNRAEQGLKTLQGEGPFGERFSLFLRQASGEIFRPESILLMGFASATFRLARFATLSRLAASPSAGIFTRGLGARAGAGFAGWFAETHALTLGSTFFESLAGHPAQLTGFGKNWSTNALLLGNLRLFGAAGATLATPRTAFLAQQAGIYGGILSAHSLENHLGLKGAAPNSNPWADSFLTWLHFNAGGAVAKRALGSNFQRWEAKIDAVSQRLGPPFSSPTRSQGEVFGWAVNAPTGKPSTSQPLAAGLRMLSTGGGKIITHPKLARFNLLWEKPNEVTLGDIQFWAQELNADPSNPKRILEAMKILHRIEDTKANSPNHMELAREAMQAAIGKTSSKQLAVVRDLVTSEYQSGKSVIHGCRYIELVAFLHPKFTMRLKAAWMRRKFDKNYERDSQDHASFRRMSLAERETNFEEAVKLRDEGHIQRWMNFLFQSPASVSEELTRIFRLHPNAIVRDALINRLKDLQMDPRYFEPWWAEGERERILADFESGEKGRAEKALMVLIFFRSNGNQEAETLYTELMKSRYSLENQLAILSQLWPDMKITPSR